MPPVDKKVEIALGLGSNLGDRLKALQAGVAALKAFLDIEIISPVYETAAAYVTDQPAFLNIALLGKTTLAPESLLQQLKNLEIEIGRRPSFRYGPRLLDIDILFYGDVIQSVPALALPHPRLAERDFVLKPLADIAPVWRHPQSGLTPEEMLRRLPPSSAVNLGNLLHAA